MTKFKMRIAAMLESNGDVTFFAGITKPGFKNELHTAEKKFQVCGTKNYEYMVTAVMEAACFFGIPRYDVIAEIMQLHNIDFIDKNTLADAIKWWHELESWKPQYQEWK